MIKTKTSARLVRTIQSHSQLDLSNILDLATASVQSCGGSCDVYRCELESRSVEDMKGKSHGHSAVVAVKRLRYFGCLDPRTEISIAEELRIWASLDHPNLLPLKGYVCIPEWGPYPAFVSDWMENGTVDRYIRENESVDSLSLVRGIVAGLRYLHSRNIVHSDLKCANILISPTGAPLLADFGFSRRLILSTNCTSRDIAGTLRWCAPELLFGQLDEAECSSTTSGKGSRPTMESDIWALGMTILEIITKDIPYGNNVSNTQVVGLIFKRELPQKFQMVTIETVEDFLWNICEDCWNYESKLRPTAGTIENTLREYHPPLSVVDESDITNLGSTHVLDNFQVTIPGARSSRSQSPTSQKISHIASKFSGTLSRIRDVEPELREKADTQALKEADSPIPNLQFSLSLAFDDYPEIYTLVCELGNAFFDRFERAGDPSDLKMAISYLQCVVHGVADHHPDRFTWLFKLTKLHMWRFDLSAEIQDLHDAICLGLQAIQGLSTDCSERPALLCTLGFLLGLRFERLGDRGDLEDGVSYCEECLSMLPRDHPSRPGQLLNLALFYSLKFSFTQSHSDISLAITHQHSSIELTLESHDSKPDQYMTLVDFLLKRLEVTQCRTTSDLDLSEAIWACNQALALTLPEDDEIFTRIFCLGTLHRMRYERSGDIDDIRDAIDHQQILYYPAVNNHPKKPEWQYELAKSLLARHNIHGNLNDLTHAIYLIQLSLDRTKLDDPSKAMRLSTLGFALHLRYRHGGNDNDLQDAVSHQELAVRVAPNESMFLASLGLVLHARFEKFGNARDLRDAIGYLKKAVQLTEDGHPEKSKRVFHLNSLVQMQGDPRWLRSTRNIS